MELMTSIVVISILCLIAMQTFSHISGKAELARCHNNLRNLYAAAAAYVTDQGSWPQIPVDDLEDPSYVNAWIDAFKPYKLSKINWICPAIQKALGDPPYEKDDHLRIDYIGTPFGDTQAAPYLWPNHPWFMERGDVHGDGNLIIFTNGQIKSLTEVKKDARTIAVP